MFRNFLKKINQFWAIVNGIRKIASVESLCSRILSCNTRVILLHNGKVLLWERLHL